MGVEGGRKIKVNSQVDAPFEDRFLGVEEGSDQGKFSSRRSLEDRLWASTRAAIKVNSQVDTPFED